MNFELFCLICFVLLGVLLYLNSRERQPSWFIVWLLYLSVLVDAFADWTQSVYG